MQTKQVFYKTIFITMAIFLFSHSPLSARISTVKVTGGIIEGSTEDGISSFKGIPFAAPPIGDLRWRAPQPVIPWEGIKQTREFAPGPVQDTEFGAVLGGPQIVSEDCLYLNVWTGAKKPDEKRPVMVWIYGGGFGTGMTSTPLYDGASLAKKGVVLVSVAYRLGPFGFLAHPELSKETGKGSGCYGIQDQIAGIKWVNENIANFGGDPSNITIFGESAGAKSIGFIVTSPMAKGFFHRAISQSGGAAAPPVYTLKEAEAMGKDYLSRVGADDIRSARSLSAEQIQSGTKGSGDFRPVPDGRTIVDDPYELLETGNYNDTPILIGTNSDEGGLFLKEEITKETFKQYVEKKLGPGMDALLKVYPHTTDAEAIRSAKDIIREYGYAWSTFNWAELHSGNGRNRAFVYYYDHRTPAYPEGANHASELAYVFDNLMSMPDQPENFPGPEDKALSDLLTSYWINFAKNGDPNGPGLPFWPPFDKKERKTMFFDENPSARPHPNLEKIRTFDVYFSKRRKEVKSER